MGDETIVGLELARRALSEAAGGVGKKMPGLSMKQQSRRKRLRHGMVDPAATELNVLTEREVKRFRELTEGEVAKLNGRDELTVIQAMLVSTAARCERVVQETLADLKRDMKPVLRRALHGQVMKASKMRDDKLRELGLLVGVKADIFGGD